ncbi:polar amino acid transport system permease protein [Azospirillum lipoferum]|uniref:Amino acid ABC transporter permease n=1 Tax=Azospirillum lipoferum TaxID=193 RepID=A0A5A9GK03_AZOLI|nr:MULTISPECIES: amino acid ABC transporter permease [Azospirillum]KAA0594175.1 amino acid ABC transporter permease [Azospirillum lipoferum]MCP1615309.1 polar amino acid transport system permease protein [Azospirillum lipoferum]MDW5531543.1 amino acid ABC transporter permease [Azospirillum sp. NL1]
MLDFALLVQYGPALLRGFGVTILCWGAGCLIGMALGFVLMLLRQLPVKPLRWIIRAYIEVIRGTPFLIQLFLLYSGGPSIGLRLEATTAGILGLGIYGSAYFAEIFRAGYQAVPKGQVEAALSLGMSYGSILRRVIVPAMLVSTIPAIVNMMAILTKETVVLSIITVPELMYEMQTMAAETFATFETILGMALFYWLLVEVVSRLGRRLEARATRFLTHASPQGSSSETATARA